MKNPKNLTSSQTYTTRNPTKGKSSKTTLGSSMFKMAKDDTDKESKRSDKFADIKLFEINVTIETAPGLTFEVAAARENPFRLWYLFTSIQFTADTQQRQSAMNNH